MNALHARIAFASLAGGASLLYLLLAPWPWQTAALLPLIALALSLGQWRAPASADADGADAAAPEATATAMHKPAHGIAEVFGSGTVEATVELTAVLGLDGRVRAISDGLARRLGDGENLLRSGSFSDRVYPSDRARWIGGLLGIGRPLAGPDGARRSFELERLHLLRSSDEKGMRSSDETEPRSTEGPLLLDVEVSDHRNTPGIDGLLLRARDVGDQFASERATARSERKFASVFHASADAIVIARATDLLVLDFNPAFTPLFGVSREQAIGVALDALGLWPNADAAHSFADRLRATADGVDERASLRHSGTGDVIETRISARYTEIDGELALLLVIRDETDREQARAALREVERKFTVVFNAAPDGIVIVRAADQVVLDVNDYLCELTGASRESLLGRPLAELRAFEDNAIAQHARQMLERLGGYRNIEFAIRHRNGETIPALVSATAVDLDDEACVLVLLRDMRDQRRTELALRRADARFRTAFEDAPMGMALVDANLAIIEANHWLADMLGLQRGALAGVPFTQALPEDERAALWHSLARLRAGETDTLHREQRLLGTDGELRHAILHAALQDDDDGAAGATPYFIIQLVDITEIKRSQEQMERLAFYDPLTGLANRRLFMDRLERSVQHTRRSGKPSALLFLDLDQFKKVNDSHGHEVGDELLKTIAERLRGAVRREDTVARLGGDEFNVLLHEVRDVDAAGQVAEHLLQVLRTPVVHRGFVLEVTSSIGIAMIPSDGGDAATLMQRADHAMYQAKQQGRNTARFYADALSSSLSARMSFASALEQALRGDELTLFYQPIMRLDGSAVVGVEALLRWQHPQRGLLAPASFLEAGEHAGLMRELDLFTLRTALRQLVAFDAASHTPEMQIPWLAVNLSGQHIGDTNFVRALAEALAESGVAPARIALELPERLLTRDLELAQLWLSSLRALGAGVTIDDFGAEASSINAITRLPVQRVKLDTSVVQRLPSSRDAALLAETVVSLCRQTQRELIAEGVETEAQRERLLRAGCELAQGYLLAPPQTGIELAQRLYPEPVQSDARLPGREPNAASRPAPADTVGSPPNVTLDALQPSATPINAPSP